MSDEELKIEILRILACCAETGNNILESLKTLVYDKKIIEVFQTGNTQERINRIYFELISVDEKAKALLAEYYEKMILNAKDLSDIFEYNINVARVYKYMKKNGIAEDVKNFLNNKVKSIEDTGIRL